MCLLLDMKTDLNLLLECLKSQMDCPLSQQEAVVTIYSICQQNSKKGFSLETVQAFMFTICAKKLVGTVKMSKGQKA